MNNTSFIKSSFPKNVGKFRTFITSIMREKLQLKILAYNIKRFTKII